MNPVKVRKNEMLDAVRENREKHKDTFERATEAYRTRMEKHLEQMLDDVRHRRPVGHMINMPVPEDHTLDYDRVIKMLEMAVDDEFVIHEQDFNCYVMDQWAWSAAWGTSTASYVVT